MKIEIGVTGKGIVITTLRKYEERQSKAFRAGFKLAKNMYNSYPATSEEDQ